MIVFFYKLLISNYEIWDILISLLNSSFLTTIGLITLWNDSCKKGWKSIDMDKHMKEKWKRKWKNGSVVSNELLTSAE